jgi:hypothetical protein
VTEADIQRDILRYLALRGVFAWPTHGPRNKPVVPGVPDIIGAKDGRMIAIEVKDRDGVISERQEAFHAGLFRVKVRVIVARSVDDVIAAGL